MALNYLGAGYVSMLVYCMVVNCEEIVELVEVNCKEEIEFHPIPFIKDLTGDRISSRSRIEQQLRISTQHLTSTN